MSNTITFDDCERIAAAHHAADAPIPFSPTPKAIAAAAGRRFARALAALTPDECTRILAEMVVLAVPGPSEDENYTLLISRPAPRDPQP